MFIKGIEFVSTLNRIKGVGLFSGVIYEDR